MAGAGGGWRGGHNADNGSSESVALSLVVRHNEQLHTAAGTPATPRAQARQHTAMGSGQTCEQCLAMFGSCYITIASFRYNHKKSLLGKGLKKCGNHTGRWWSGNFNTFFNPSLQSFFLLLIYNTKRKDLSLSRSRINITYRSSAAPGADLQHGIQFNQLEKLEAAKAA